MGASLFLELANKEFCEAEILINSTSTPHFWATEFSRCVVFFRRNPNASSIHIKCSSFWLRASKHMRGQKGEKVSSQLRWTAQSSLMRTLMGRLLASLLYFSRALIIYFADAQTCGKHLLISIFTHSSSPFGEIANAYDRHIKSWRCYIFYIWNKIRYKAKIDNIYTETKLYSRYGHFSNQRHVTQFHAGQQISHFWVYSVSSAHAIQI